MIDGANQKLQVSIVIKIDCGDVAALILEREPVRNRIEKKPTTTPLRSYQ
jgi:hypothetical protein